LSRLLEPNEAVKFGKKLLHECDIEAVIQRLDKLARDESQIAISQTLDVVYGLVQNMRVVEEGEQILLCLSHNFMTRTLDNKASKDNIQKALGRLPPEKMLKKYIVSHHFIAMVHEMASEIKQSRRQSFPRIPAPW
jgi:hypothetical protein